MLKTFLQNVVALVLVITISAGFTAEFDATNTENSGITTYGRGDLDSPEEEH